MLLGGYPLPVAPPPPPSPPWDPILKLTGPAAGGTALSGSVTSAVVSGHDPWLAGGILALSFALSGTFFVTGACLAAYVRKLDQVVLLERVRSDRSVDERMTKAAAEAAANQIVIQAMLVAKTAGEAAMLDTTEALRATRPTQLPLPQQRSRHRAERPEEQRIDLTVADL